MSFVLGSRREEEKEGSSSNCGSRWRASWWFDVVGEVGSVRAYWFGVWR